MEPLEQFTELTLPIQAVVTGDTHVRRGRPTLPDQLLQAISGSDLTIHTGDLCDVATRDLLASHGPVLAVTGNNEEPELNDSLPLLLRIRAGSLRILLTHGHLERGSSARSAVQREYAGEEDLVIFGHSHQPCWEEVDGTRFLNPGSPTTRRREPNCSFVTMSIDGRGKIDVSFVTLE